MAQSLVNVPDTKARPVPEQYLTFITIPVKKDKQMPAERIFAHEVLHQHRQLIKAAAHVRRLGIDEYLYRRGKCQHKPACFKAESA
jgi:hypothetical protein